MPKKEEIKVEEKVLFTIKQTSEIPRLPELTDKTKLDVRYPLIEPYAYVHIYWDPQSSELVYDIEEPKLDQREKTILTVLEEGVRELINITFINVKDINDVLAYLEKNLKVLLTELDIKVNEESFLKMMYYIYRNFVGFNEIEPLMRDYFIEDIECNGVNTPLYIVHRKYRNLRTTVEFKDFKKLAGFVEKLAQKCGKYVSYADPLLDGALPDGSVEFNEPLVYKENEIVKISKIGEFVDKFYKNDSNNPVKVKNIKVPAFGKDLKIKWKKTDYVYRHKNSEKLYKLSLEFGRSVALTKYHSIFALTKEGIKAKKTSELKLGDYIVAPLEIPENNKIKEINLIKKLSKTGYINLFKKTESDTLTSLIPIELFNPLKDLHNGFDNKRISRPRLRRILNEIRFKRFNDLINVDSRKFLREWIQRGYLTKKGFTDKGKELLNELKIVDKLIDSNLGFFKIKNISKVNSNSKYVYDLSVKDDENFVSGFGGVCCHNSRVNATYTGDITSRGPTFCIADGYVQLNNGVFKKIDTLFNECKEKFDSKIENGNEVVEVTNLNCCGVDENNLEQIDSRIKTVIKLKPPEELVEIELEDGSNITVTTNHKFHIIDNKLNLIEAKDLRKGMFMPIPTKVNVIGYQQKINTYNLIKDFSYIKKVCIISNNIVKDIVSTEIASFKNSKGFYRQQMSEEFGIHNSYFYEVITRGCSISFNILDKICTTRGHNFEDLGEISLVVYGGGTKDKTKDIRVPSIVDENLAYLTGVLISDGHLSKEYLDISCYDLDIKERIKAILKEKFGFYNSYYDDNRVYLCNVFVPYFFNKIFGIPIGHKTFNVRIPEIISKSDNKAIASFIKGLFDGDGTSKSGLSYKSYSKELIYGLTYLLARLGIYSYIRETNFGKKTEYKLNIPSIYYQKYLDLIGFESKEKLNYLKKLISKQIDHKTNIRHGRVPSRLILELINKLNLSKSEISKRCNVSYNRFRYDTFSRTFVRRFLDIIKDKKEVQEEIKFIKWMLNSNQEFVKIKNIKIFDNKDKKPVYDIELEPCKFFIAGNKPMNIFDTIRKFTSTPWSPVQLMQFRTVSPELLAFLWILIEHESNIMIIGGTGSGKTSFLNALAFFIPPQARVVSIEDSVTGDSKIIIKQEQKIKNISIKEFIDKKIDAEVMTLDENGKIIFTKPSKYIKHKVKKDIYEIITSTGRRVKVTQDHSLFTLGNNSLKEVRPLDLEENKSFIATPRSLPINGKKIEEINLINSLSNFKENFLQGEPIKKIFKKYSFRDLKVSKSCYAWWKRYNLIRIKKFTELNVDFSYDELKKLKIKSKNRAHIPVIFKITKEFLEFCGLWIGDGSYDNYNKNSVIVSNSDEECRRVIKNVADYLGSNYSRMNDKGVSLRIHNAIFYKFMKNVLKFRGYSRNKKIPEFIFGLSNEQLKHFIRGYYSADGTVKKSEVACTSQSYKLLEGLQTIFLRFGIISRINKHTRKDKCIDMCISSNENINRFKEIGFLQERKNIKLSLLNKNANHACSDIIPLTELKINKLNNLVNNQLSSGYLRGRQNIGRNYLQRIAPIGSEFNDISHNDILWDKVIKVRKISSKEAEVFDLSIPGYEKFLCNNIFVHNTKELNLLHENWLPSVARAGVGLAGITGAKHGEVSLFDLLKESFRQRPDYVIVGEIRGSLAKDEEVVVIEDGLTKRLKIKDLEKKDLSNILVPALDHDMKIRLHKIKKFIKHPAKGKLVEIITRSGRRVKITEDHSLFTADGVIIKSVETKKLKKGDRILIPSRMPYGYNDIKSLNILDLLPDLRIEDVRHIVKEAISKIGQAKANEICGCVARQYCRIKQKTYIPYLKFKKLIKEAGINFDFNSSNYHVRNGNGITFSSKLVINNDFCRLLGYYLSEGHLEHRSLVITNSNKKIINDVCNISERLFGIKPKIRDVYGWGRSKHIIITSTILTRVLEKIGVGRTTKKRVSPIIYGLSKEKICSFLRGVFSGDGSFHRNEISFTSKLEKLCEDIGYLLYSLGIVARISKQKKNCYRIRFKGIEDTDKFLKEVGFVQKQYNVIQKGPLHSPVNKVIFNNDLDAIKLPRKYRHLKRFRRCGKVYLKKVVEDLQLKGQIEKFANGDFYLDEIKSINEINLTGKEFVYDLSINPAQSFIGGFGGVILHNSEAYVLFQGMASIQGDEEIFVLNDNHLKKLKIKDLKNKDLTKLKLVAVDPDTKEIKIAPIKALKEHPPRKVLYKIKTESGKEISTTPDHSAFTSANNKIIPVEVGKLKKGDLIVSVDVKEDIKNSKIFNDKIKSIRKITLSKPKPVYDVSVPGMRNFIGANGVLLHNSGHPSFGTMHAENVETMIRRLETPPISLPASLVASMDAVCTMVQVKVSGKSVRRLRDVVEIINVTEQGVISNKPFVWDPKTDGFFFKTDSKIFDKIVIHHGVSREQLQLEFRRRTELLMKLYQNNITGYKEVHDIINIYYKTPERVLAKFGIR